MRAERIAGGAANLLCYLCMSEDERLSPRISPEQERFARLLFPYLSEQYLRIRKAGTRFVHYTNAEAAMCILRGKHIWMRASSCMNDVSEVRYGLGRLWN